MRARNIKPGFFRNEQLMQIAPLGRLLFAGLWCLADREGRLLDRPNQIKWDVLPADDCDADALLDDLATRGFIRRYEAEGKRCIQIPKFRQHQKPHPNEKAFLIPPPPPDTAPARKRTSIGLNDEYMNDKYINHNSSQPKPSKYDLPLLLEDYRPPTETGESISRIAIAWYTLTGETISLADRQHIRQALTRGLSEETITDLITTLGSTAQAKPLRLSTILAAQLANRSYDEQTPDGEPSPTAPSILPSPSANTPPLADRLPLPDASTSPLADKQTSPSANTPPLADKQTLPSASTPPLTETQSLPDASTPPSDEAPTSTNAAQKPPNFFTRQDGNAQSRKPHAPTKPSIKWEEGFFGRGK